LHVFGRFARSSTIPGINNAPAVVAIVCVGIDDDDVAGRRRRAVHHLDCRRQFARRLRARAVQQRNVARGAVNRENSANR
jgi:hypothetical protein